MFLPMRRFGFMFLWVVPLRWLCLGHARLGTVLSCGYRLGGEAAAPGYAKTKGRSPLRERQKSIIAIHRSNIAMRKSHSVVNGERLSWVS